MNRANALSGAEWLKRSFSVWRGLGRDNGGGGHPAPFPVALAERIIECYAADGAGTVLDPFAGSGSALIAALQKGMDAVGLDVNPDYRDMFEQRLSLFSASGHWRYEVCDARALGTVVDPCSVEICITSPPYWDIQNRRRSADGKASRPYSNNGHDLGNMDHYGEFLAALGCVAAQVETALRPKGYFVLNVMDIRKKSLFYPLHQDAAASVGDHTSLTLEDIIIWDRQQDYSAMRPLGYPYKFIVNKVHEYLLVFRKGDSSGTAA